MCYDKSTRPKTTMVFYVKAHFQIYQLYLPVTHWQHDKSHKILMWWEHSGI